MGGFGLFFFSSHFCVQRLTGTDARLSLGLISERHRARCGAIELDLAPEWLTEKGTCIVCHHTPSHHETMSSTLYCGGWLPVFGTQVKWEVKPKNKEKIFRFPARGRTSALTSVPGHPDDIKGWVTPGFHLQVSF